MTPDFSRHFRLWSIPVYVLVLTLVTQVPVVQVKYLTHTILMQCLTLSVRCSNLNFLCLNHDLLRQIRLQRLVYRPIIFSIYITEFSRLVLIILRVFVYRCHRHFVCLFGEHIYKSTSIMEFVTFWSSAGQLVSIIPVLFQYILTFTIIRAPRNSPLLLMSICRQRLRTTLLLVHFLLVRFRVLWRCPLLNSVPKPDTTERRIILDLSWPVGSSVNDGIPSGLYLAQEFALVYPTVDLIADRVAALGPGCLLFKRDLRRAYRQFPVDPYDYPLLGYSWNDHYYFDVVLPMGLRTAAMACQRSTNAVSYILSRAGCQVTNYLDDFIGVASITRASQDYEYCGSLLHELGLQESLSKACPPSTVMTCLGVRINTVDMTLSVTPERLDELVVLLSHWLTKKSATKSELQSLVGKLSFVSKCVRQSRLFLARILAMLRTVKRNHHHVKLSKEFFRDIHWWLRFIHVYNGVSIIPTSAWSSPDAVFATDACLSGCGGLTCHQFFHIEFPRKVKDKFPSIHHLEVLAILLAARLWGSQWRGLRLLVYCDNAAVVSSLNSGRVQDSILAACLRELWFLAASHEFELRAVHLSSAANRLADLLSRWHLNLKFQEEFHAKTASLNMQDVTVPLSYFHVADSV